MIVAVDFDGTLVTDKFPTIGEPYFDRIDLVKQMRSKGHKVILWTCRTGEVLEEAVKFCQEHGLEFDAVNKNLPEVIAKWGGDTRKVYCDFYIDDKALNDLQLNRVILSQWGLL